MLQTMGALKNLWQSERGMVAFALIVAASVLCGTGAINADQWLDYTKWIFIPYAAAKTITGATALLTSTPPAQPNPALEVLAHVLAGNLPPKTPTVAHPESTVPKES